MDNIEKYIEITYTFDEGVVGGSIVTMRFLPSRIAYYETEIPIYDEYGAVVDWYIKNPVYEGYYYDGMYVKQGNSIWGPAEDTYPNYRKMHNVAYNIEASRPYSELEHKYYTYSAILNRLQNGEFMEDIMGVGNYYYDFENTYPSFRDDCIYKKLPVQIDTLIIPPQIEVIGPGAFAGLEIKQLQLPNSLKKIGIGAFLLSGDDELIPDDAPSRTSPSSLTIPSNVTYIRGKAFKGWNNLRIINLPNNFKLSEFEVSIYKEPKEVIYSDNNNIFAVEKNKGDNIDAYGNQITTINGNKYNREFVKWALLMNRNVNNISENSLENGFIQVHINGGNNLQIPFYYAKFSVAKIYDLKEKYSIIKFNIKVKEYIYGDIWNWIFITDKYISGLTMPIKLHIGNKLYYVVGKLYLKDLGGNNG